MISIVAGKSYFMIRQAIRRLTALAGFAFASCQGASVVWAQPVEGASAEKNYAMPYLLVILLVVLGLLVVLRPSIRAYNDRLERERF